MGSRVQSLFQRQLHQRHVGVGVDQQEGDEYTVIEATFAVRGGGYSGLAEQAADVGGQLRVAGRGVLQAVGVLGKAVIVE